MPIADTLNLNNTQPKHMLLFATNTHFLNLIFLHQIGQWWKNPNYIIYLLFAEIINYFFYLLNFHSHHLKHQVILRWNIIRKTHLEWKTLIYVNYFGFIKLFLKLDINFLPFLQIWAFDIIVKILIIANCIAILLEQGFVNVILDLLSAYFYPKYTTNRGKCVYLIC